MESPSSSPVVVKPAGEKPPLFPKECLASFATDISGGLIYTKGNANRLAADDHEKRLLTQKLKDEKTVNKLLYEKWAVVQERIEELEKWKKEYGGRLECGICFSQATAVSFHCGHSACRECAKKLKKCHVCRTDLRVFTPIYPK